MNIRFSVFCSRPTTNNKRNSFNGKRKTRGVCGEVKTGGRGSYLLINGRPLFGSEGLLRWLDDDSFTTDFDRTFVPALDVEEKEGEYLVKADLPGLKKDDIHIELRNGMLTLRGERRDEHEEKKGRYYRVERTYGSFERSFCVPEGVTEKDIHAKYTNGVLELSIPVPKAPEPKAIEVKVE